MTDSTASNEPVLIAQRTRRNRIAGIGLFGVPLLVTVATLFAVVMRYLSGSRLDTLSDVLLAVALCSAGILILAPLVAWILIPKVEFFDRYVAIRSSAGRWRKHGYGEIEVMVDQHGILFFMFKDGDHISLTSGEIDLNGLVSYLCSRDVAAAQNILSVEQFEEPHETLQGRGSSLSVVPPYETPPVPSGQATVPRVSEKVDPSSLELQPPLPAMNNLEVSQQPFLTAQRPKRNRIVIAGWLGVFLLGLVFTVLVMVRQYLRDPTQENLISVVWTLALSCIWPCIAAVLLVPKVDFFDRHLVARSTWGRSRKRDYLEIDAVELNSGVLFIKFKDQSRIALFRSQINFEDIAKFLASRDVTAAQALPWVD